MKHGGIIRIARAPVKTDAKLERSSQATMSSALFLFGENRGHMGRGCRAHRDASFSSGSGHGHRSDTTRPLC